MGLSQGGEPLLADDQVHGMLGADLGVGDIKSDPLMLRIQRTDHPAGPQLCGHPGQIVPVEPQSIQGPLQSPLGDHHPLHLGEVAAGELCQIGDGGVGPEQQVVGGQKALVEEPASDGLSLIEKLQLEGKGGAVAVEVMELGLLVDIGRGPRGRPDDIDALLLDLCVRDPLEGRKAPLLQQLPIEMGVQELSQLLFRPHIDLALSHGRHLLDLPAVEPMGR